MIVGKLLSLTATGLFSRATSLAEQFRMLIAGAIGGVFYPAFARIRDEGKPLGPAYLRVCAGYSAIVWPGMAGLALAAEPVVLLLYGELWAGVAPLLTMVSINAALMIALPLVSELPILLGRIQSLLVRNIAETVISIGLLVAGSLMAGVWGAAASRLVYGAAFFALYLGFMHRLVGFDMRQFLLAHTKSLGATLAAIAPLALTYWLWAGPGEIGFVALCLASGAGALCWLGAMIALRHPAMDDLRRTASPMVYPFSPRLGSFIQPADPVIPGKLP